MVERLAVILKKPSADVRVADGTVLPVLAGRSRSAEVSPGLPLSADAVEAMVQEQVQARLAEAKRQQAVQLQQAEALLRQQVGAERTAVEAERAALASAASAVERAAGELAGLRRRVLAEAERQVLELAVDMARTVLHQEVDTRRYDPAPIVQAALAPLPPRAEVTVKLHPDDFARYELAASGGDGRIRVLSDATVPAAGCRVECGQGVVDADPVKQLEEIRQALLAETGEPDAGETPAARGMGVPPMRLEGFQPSRTLDNGQNSPSGTSTATGGTPVGRMGETPMPRSGADETPAPRISDTVVTP